ncbi:hypothetical protein ONE63_010791 [Megalurothrips usitatus]|uniref:Leptin receptor overlapping transcript-like 1 n=1 Tax=Megalurothrips usitatus TaxID=439358 RepID=A0AAV7XE33_9NEOP|nr:hypothetical protein ONE63_010791 [Megalurothrips usitatus]
MKFLLRLVVLAFGGSIGMTLVTLGCALPEYDKWWPLFVVLFYLLAPVPTLVARRYAEDSGGSGGPCLELSIFITMGFIISAFALPIVLARSPADHPVIQWGACYLTLAGNVVVFLTLLGFFLTFDQEDAVYSMW